MSYHIYFRILGYIATITLHVGNLVAMAAPKSKDVLQDKRIQVFGTLQTRYLTVWTFMLQIIFAISGLWCDILTLMNSRTKGYRLPKHLKGFRDVLFAAIIWPSVFIVSTTFWTVFLYDRSLVFPEFLDKVVSPQSNHIMHTLIVPLAIWELMFQPRTTPRSHFRHLLHIIFHFGLYILVILYTFYEKNHWIYPILGRLYGTLYFYCFFALLFINSFIFYAIQWPITEKIWGKEAEKLKKKY